METVALQNIRWSDPKQEDGDSERRQTEKGKRWSAAKSIRIKKIYFNRGDSAALGNNRQTGGFAEMMKDATTLAGKGCKVYCLFENQDRFGRDDALDVMIELRSIVRMGCTIVWLDSGVETTQQNFNDLNVFFLNIINACVANQESKKKMERIGETWKQKRQATANGVKLGRNVKAWLDPVMKTGDDDKPKVVAYKPNDKAKLVQWAYESIAERRSIGSIIRKLNKDGTKPFGKGKQAKGTDRKGRVRSGLWSSTHLRRILMDPAVIGTYVPYTCANKSERRIDESMDPVTNYYPAIVSKELFLRVQEILGRNAGHGGPKTNSTNLFTKIARCKCGAAMHLWQDSPVRNGRQYHYSKLFCKSADDGGACERTQKVHCKHIERAVLTVLWSKVVPSMGQENVRKDKLRVLKHEHTDNAAKIKRLVDSLEQGTMPASVNIRILELENRQKFLAGEIEKLELLATDNPLANWKPCEPTTENRQWLQNILQGEIKSLEIDATAYKATLTTKDPEMSFELSWKNAPSNQVNKNPADFGFYLTGAGAKNELVSYLDHLLVWKSAGPVEVLTDDNGMVSMVQYNAA